MGGCTYSVQELLLNWNKNEPIDDDLVFYEEQGEIHMKTMPKKDNVPIYINSHCGTSEGYQKRKKMTSYSLKKQQNYVRIIPKKLSPLTNLPNRISPLPQSPPAKKPKIQQRTKWCGYYQCWICAKTCQSPSGLKLHMRSCGKRYSVEV